MTAIPREMTKGQWARLTRLYEQHIGGAESLAYLITGDAALAQDVAQEAFLRVAGRFTHLRRPEGFGPYLRKTVLNLCRSHLRRARLERTVLERHRESSAREDPGVEHRDELIRALLALPYRQRAAIVLRFYEDLSEERTGELLRCSSRAVNALVSRGMSTLRQRLAREDG